jgi:hypothetical protein
MFRPFQNTSLAKHKAGFPELILPSTYSLRFIICELPKIDFVNSLIEETKTVTIVHIAGNPLESLHEKIKMKPFRT